MLLTFFRAHHVKTCTRPCSTRAQRLRDVVHPEAAQEDLEAERAPAKQEKYYAIMSQGNNKLIEEHRRPPRVLLPL